MRVAYRVQRTRLVSSGLSALVDAEARLDRALSDARAEAEALRAAAHERANHAADILDAELDRERARTASAIEAATARELRELAEDARTQAARFDAIAGDRLHALAADIAHRLVEIALAEASP